VTCWIGRRRLVAGCYAGRLAGPEGLSFNILPTGTACRWTGLLAQRAARRNGVEHAERQVHTECELTLPQPWVWTEMASCRVRPSWIERR